MSLFIIPMVGLSSRFFKAGYDKPKYQLDIHGITMFEWSVRSFATYFNSDEFLFIVRDVYDTPQFVKDQAKKMGIKNYQIVTLGPTEGQAETVFLGLQKSAQTPSKDIYIFNIDSALHSFQKPKWIKECDGYLELFRGEGNHWSFAQVNELGNVIKTTEKNRVSDLCSDGLYYFKSINLFNKTYTDMVLNNKRERGEYYIAPLYNYLIEQGYTIKPNIIELDEISFCGTPDEYQTFLNKNNEL